MRVITYARVSTKSQGDRGVSLADQEDRFRRFLDDTGHVRIKAYAEAKSASTVEQRATFLKMLDELNALKPDALVIDSLDRFSRSKFEGVQQFMALADKNVKLVELEHSYDPLDLKCDEDRDHVWKSFGDADGEYRRIKKRQLKRYASQRERNFTTTNRPAFGLLLAGEKRGQRRLVPNPQTAPIVREMDRRYIAGMSQRKLLEWLEPIEGAWRSKRGLSMALRNEDDRCGYVKAGLRTPETQALIRQSIGARYAGERVQRKYTHELSGLLACGECVAAGIAPSKALLSGKFIHANENCPWTLYCEGARGGTRIHKQAYFSCGKVLMPLMDHLELLRNEMLAREILKLWKDAPRRNERNDLRAALEQQLNAIQAEENAVQRRSDAAIELAASGIPGVMKEAQSQLERIAKERSEIEARRAKLQVRLAQMPVFDDRQRVVDEVLELQRYAASWDDECLQLDEEGCFRQDLLRPYLKKWIAALGHPVVQRRERSKSGWRRANWTKVLWPTLDQLLKLVEGQRATLVRPRQGDAVDVDIPGDVGYGLAI